MKSHRIKLYSVLLGAGAVGALAVLPYTMIVLQTNDVTFGVPITTVVTVQFLETLILLAVAILAGMRLMKGAGLGLPYLEPLLAGKKPPRHFLETLFASIMSGMMVSVAIVLCDLLFFGTPPGGSLARTTAFPFWPRALAVLYGGIDEELLMRFFLMTTIAWGFMRFLRGRGKRALVIGMWASIIITSILFSIGHLPFTLAVAQLSPLVVLRALMLNGLAGVVFGWLYWERGFESAVIGHLAADVMLLLILPWYAARFLV